MSAPEELIYMKASCNIIVTGLFWVKLLVAYHLWNCPACWQRLNLDRESACPVYLNNGVVESMGCSATSWKMTKLLPVCQPNPTKNKTYQVQFCRCKGLRWSMKVGCHSKSPSRHQTFVCVLSRRSHTRRGSPQRCWDGSGRTTSFLGPQVILWGQSLWIDNAPTLTGLRNWWCSQKLREYLYGSLL
jgi:hypothetical protein